MGASDEAFDRFIAGFDYPMLLVTVAVGTSPAERDGCLVGFFTQCSIDPPRLVVCLSVNNRTCRLARRATLLGLHRLEDGQRQLAELFGSVTGDDVDKFASCRWHAGTDGVPVLDDCPVHLVGRVLGRQELGDHVGFLLEPVAGAGESSGPPLTFQRVKDLPPGHEA